MKPVPLHCSPTACLIRCASGLSIWTIASKLRRLTSIGFVFSVAAPRRPAQVRHPKRSHRQRQTPQPPKQRAQQLGVVRTFAERLRYLVKQQPAACDDDVKSDKGKQGFGVEVQWCRLLFGGQPPLFCARLITSRASSAARAVAVICSARCPSTMASNSASLTASTGSRLRAVVSATFIHELVPGPCRIWRISSSLGIF